MCVVNTPDPPKITQTPRLPDAGARIARDEELARRRRSFGRSATLLTGSQGVLNTASTTSNTLLGASG